MDAATVDGFRERVIKALRTVAPTAGAHPNRNSRHGWNQLCQSRFSHSAESADVLNSRHQ
jgi:hypothetical protein